MKLKNGVRLTQDQSDYYTALLTDLVDPKLHCCPFCRDIESVSDGLSPICIESLICRGLIEKLVDNE